MCHTVSASGAFISPVSPKGGHWLRTKCNLKQPMYVSISDNFGRSACTCLDQTVTNSWKAIAGCFRSHVLLETQNHPSLVPPKMYTICAWRSITTLSLYPITSSIFDPVPMFQICSAFLCSPFKHQIPTASMYSVIIH